MSATTESLPVHHIRPSRRLKWSLSAIVVIALSITLRGGGTHFLLALSCLSYVVLPWYLAGWAKRWWLPFVGRGHSTIPRGIRRNSGLFVTSAIAVVISFVPGCAIEHQRQDATKEWSNEVISAIESYHDVRGVYPESMSTVADLTNAPALVRAGLLHYEKTDTGFDLDLWDEDSLIFPVGWMWSLRSRAWKRYD